MDKRPLIGVSLYAVVLLVLGSLNNVVGYQSVKSTINDSPLFNVRTQRATSQQQKVLTSQYLGKGKGSLLQFPIRDSQTEQLRKAIDIISNMDDTTFARFAEACFQKAKQNDTQQDLIHYQIIQALLLLKTNPDAIIKSYTNRNNHELPPTTATYCGTYTMCGAATPGCWILTLITFFIIIFIIFPITYILDLLTIRTPRCTPS